MTSVSAKLEPRPSRSNIFLPAKWVRDVASKAGHETFVHFQEAKPSSLTILLLQEGQTPPKKSKILKGWVLGGLFSLLTFIIAGIISPDFSMITVSPILISFLLISSSL